MQFIRITDGTSTIISYGLANVDDFELHFFATVTSFFERLEHVVPSACRTKKRERMRSLGIEPVHNLPSAEVGSRVRVACVTRLLFFLRVFSGRQLQYP